MSGAGENRWRRPGQGNRQNTQDRSGSNTPSKEGGRPQSVAAPPANAWGQGKGKGAGGGDKAPAAPSAPVQADTHVPVRDFNAGEVKDYLKKRYRETIGDQTSVHYKVQSDTAAKKNPWGSRGNTSHMNNGQDFFTQLKKQLPNLDQGKPS